MSADRYPVPAGSEPRPEPRDTMEVAVDWSLVRRLHEVTATALAEELKRRPEMSSFAQQELARTLVQDSVDDLVRERMRAGEVVPSAAEEAAIAEAVFAAQFGLGRLQPYVDDPLVENIEVHGHDNVWIGYADGRDARVGPIADSDEDLVRQLQHIAARLGRAERTLTTASPLLTMRLPDGSRLAAVIETVPRPQLVIRRHRIRNVDLDDLVELGALDRALAEFLRAGVRARKNIIVTGAQGAGKTLLLRALANELPVTENLATIEKHFELLLHELPDRHPRVVPFEARDGTGERGPDGRRLGEVTLTELVEQALVMNVSRVWLGEVRGEEAWPLIEVMEAGEGGSCCTLHARSARHAFERLANLCMRGRAAVTPEHAYRSCAAAIDLVVHITTVDERWTGGQRQRFVSQVVECNGIGEGGRPALTEVFAPGPDGRAVPEHDPVDLADYVRVGFDPAWLRSGPVSWAGAAGGRR
ncbi:CpaF family protein [Blastococcus sp. URHD0036]|uniref:CpaF family protein n=1 Tax=Blastococcus sp. URHD0036 TaxID=1380356 RepID=UPI001E3F450B|nr:ATPase, T2SS/T4P/T4SS family [Blastococcus sp. URHD0036]